MVLRRGQARWRDNLRRNGSAGRADLTLHGGSCAGGSLGLATAVMTDNGSRQATMGAEEDYQASLSLSSRKGESWGIWKVGDPGTILGQVPASSM